MIMKKTVIGITVVGKDAEGIVAAFTNFVFTSGGNIEKVNQNVIKGLFGMYLEASFPQGVDAKEFGAGLHELAGRVGMDVDAHHETNSQKNVAVMVTKEPHCLQAILDNAASLKGRISVVIGTEDVLKPLADGAGVPFVMISGRDQQKAEEQIIGVCRQYDVDLIVLARYMRILTPNFVWRYPDRIINIHPSLLPAFPGALAYAQAYERGTKVVGITTHYVTESLDQGPIILQDSFKVSPDDTLEKIKAKGRKLEADTLLRSVKMHLEGRLEIRWRKVHTHDA